MPLHPKPAIAVVHNSDHVGKWKHQQAKDKKSPPRTVAGIIVFARHRSPPYSYLLWSEALTGPNYLFGPKHNAAAKRSTTAKRSVPGCASPTLSMPSFGSLRACYGR